MRLQVFQGMILDEIAKSKNTSSINLGNKHSIVCHTGITGEAAKWFMAGQESVSVPDIVKFKVTEDGVTSNLDLSTATSENCLSLVSGIAMDTMIVGPIISAILSTVGIENIDKEISNRIFEEVFVHNLDQSYPEEMKDLRALIGNEMSSKDIFKNYVMNASIFLGNSEYFSALMSLVGETVGKMSVDNKNLLSPGSEFEINFGKL